MAGLLVFCLAAVCTCVTGEFHLPSRIQYDGADGSLFGFSLSYQKSKGKLIVGTPRIDLEGGVESCPIWPTGADRSCGFILQSKNINSTWGEFTREFSPDQHFMLGATVAATSDYVLACAPLFTINQKSVNSETNKQHTKILPVGRCFIQKDAAGPSLLIPYQQDNKGTSLGWSAWVDEADDMLLISKLTGAHSAVMYTRASNPAGLEQANIAPIIKTQRYLGSAMTSGVFFSDKKKVYAIALEDTKRKGYIGFLHFVKGSLRALSSRRERIERVRLISAKGGRNMFGASLLMADFSRDGFSELVAGAPAQPYRDEYEAGSIFIYRGGFATKQIEKNICVCHNRAGSRFGTALASMDLDDDGLPELFISAPYEKKGGTVYVVSGAGVKALLEKEREDCTLITDIHHQPLSSEHKSFGYVMQPALNFNNNGGKVLAIGAPLVDKVFVYRSIPAVKVEISAKLKDKDIVLELDKHFTVTVIINITYPVNQTKSSGLLFVTTDISDRNQNQKPVMDENQKFTIDLAKHETRVIKDVVVNMNDEKPHTYDFVARVDIDKSLLVKKEFDESLIRLSENSVRQYSLEILRRCKGGECVPKLSMELKWSKSCPKSECTYYVLGSSLNETMTVAIRNDGDNSYVSCAKVYVTGAKIADWSCDPREIRDTCRFKEIKRSSEHPLTIKLDMSKFSYGAEKLDVVVELFNSCSDKKPTQTEKKTINYELNSNEIVVKGFYYPLNVTDRDIADTTLPTVGLLETFTIQNNGPVVWEQLLTEIKILKQPYINDFVILNEDFYCAKQNDTKYIKYSNCTLNLDANSYIELKTQVNITKNAVVKYTNKNNSLVFKTEIILGFSPTEINNFTLDATAMYVKDKSFKNQKSYIIILAVVVATIVLLIIGIILFKCGFFERNTKKELIELKKEFKRRSTMRRPESSCYRRVSEGELHIEEIHEDQETLVLDHPKSS
ncbi:integrin alpha-4-like [Aricia agestis]|uniref:integrin alpha-4-like n=1 Tax=Aricia agestis TaxID=91739 RepID=UPI001C20B4BD|nr:integrin alpha-4-like [Aricia agestis]